MKAKYKTLLSILTIAIAFTAGVYSRPAKIETKIVEVIKTVKEEAKTRVIYRDKVTKPDGTITEKEVEREDTQSKELAVTNKESESVTTNDVGLVISTVVTFKATDPNGDREYSVVASKRLIGALNMTGLVSNQKRVGIGFGWSF